MRLFWHRRDLRVHDNVGLAAASAAGSPPLEAGRNANDGQRPGDGGSVVLPVFVLDPRILEHATGPRVAFLRDALASLRREYRDRGGDLLVVRGRPSERLVDLVTEYDAPAVHWNRDHSGLARRRDERVRNALRDAGSDVEVVTHDDCYLHEPGAVRTNAGDPYQVFTPFWEKWRDCEKPLPRPTPDSGRLATPGDAGEIPSLDALGFDEPTATIPDAGPGAARERLTRFVAEDLPTYADRRDRPAERATSRLSPHLRWGTIGIREVWAATRRAKAMHVSDPAADDDRVPNPETARDSIVAYRRQLAWRDFYGQVIHFNPRVVAENYRDFENEIAWRDAPDHLDRWKAGETGYPIVDAGIRQLRDEGHLHNRARMIVASFLTKDLLIDWRAGYDWFRERLIDHDPANDSGGWQWAASTGTDAQPYFRIFNPATQAERYDPDGEYVRRHVPELRDATTDAIHGWPTLDPAEREAEAPDYPAPIVDHDERRTTAIELFERARGE